MNDDHDDRKKIIIGRIIEYKQMDSSQNESAPLSPLKRWLLYLALIPLFIGMLALGVLFFSIFFALFAIVAVGIGIRLWWLRRKLKKAGKFAEEAQSVEIEDAEIIETRTNKSERK